MLREVSPRIRVQPFAAADVHHLAPRQGVHAEVDAGGPDKLDQRQSAGIYKPEAEQRGGNTQP